MLRVAVACDHAGFLLKKLVIETIEMLGFEVVDFGAFDDKSVDYPDFTFFAGKAIENQEVDRAVIICGSGIGASITANKIKGVYAAVCHDTYTARQGVEHDGMNALCIGARVIGEELAKDIIISFLNAQLDLDARHQRRREKIKAIENGNFKIITK